MSTEYIRGLQHIGIPTRDVEKTISFYEGLGFHTTYRLHNEEHNVAFLENQGMVVETYLGDMAGRTGAIDHITLDVTDIQKVFDWVKENGYTLLDPEIITLPFFDKGCSYFMIEGPNKERVEFNQIYA